MDAQIAARIFAFLDAHHVMSLATCGGKGPHAASVFYVRDGPALLWVSDPMSRHSVELAADPRVAATVAPDCADMDDVRGVQIAGHAQAVAGELQRTHAHRLFEARYPCVKRLLSAGSSHDLLAEMQFYRLEPERMTLIDNSRGFGHKEQIHLRSAADG
jgi:uncharacterized protein YhbP (UPF0306 family)